MTCKDFVVWLRGFTQASNAYNITPKQWEDIRHMLNRVDVEEGRFIKTYQSLNLQSSDNLNTSTSAPTYEPTVTHGRPEDSVTFVSNNKKVF